MQCSDNTLSQSNILENFSSLKENFEYNVELDLVKDLGINPRKINKMYAEEIPLETPAVILGVVTGEEEYVDNEGNVHDIKNKLILIDGNHRTYAKKYVYEHKFINARIIKYDTIDDAIIDAYKFNTCHGRPLTDREVAMGVSETIRILRKKEIKPSLNVIATKLGLTQRQVRMYDYWVKVENALGEEIPKSKADLLNSFLNVGANATREQLMEAVKKLRKFWELNGHLKFIELVEAKKHYAKTGEIVNYEHLKVTQMLSLDDFGLTPPVNLEDNSPKTIEVSKESKNTKNTNETSSNVCETGLINASETKESNNLEKFDKEMKKDFSKKKITLETLTLNFLSEIQEIVIDKASSFTDLVKSEVENNPETIDNLKKKEPQIRGILANIKAKLNLIENSLGIKD